MMNIIRKNLPFFMFLILVSSCKNEKTRNNGHIAQTDNIEVRDSLVQEFEITVKIKDTLMLGKRNFGNIIVLNKLHDSIKRSNEDRRIVTSCLDVYELNYDVANINVKVCDTFYQANDDFNEVRIPFYVVPQKKGKHYIGGVINEDIYLFAYKYKDTSLTRFVNFEHRFKENVYVKDTIE